MNAIRQYILSRIHSGEYRAGERLPSERTLAELMKVPQCRVRKQLQELVVDNVLVCQRGDGYFVAQAQNNRTATRRVTLITTKEHTDPRDMPFRQFLDAASEADMYLNIRQIETGKELDGAVGELLDEHDEGHGIFIMPFHDVVWGPNLSDALMKHYPVVSLLRATFPGTFSSVESNHFEAGLKAAELLRRNHYTQPIYIGYETIRDNLVPDQRLNGFLAGCKNFGLKKPRQLLYKDIEGSSLNKDLSKAWKEGKCDCLFAASAGFTSAVAAWMLQQQIKPENSWGWIGMDAPLPVPGMQRKVDCIIQDRREEASEAIKVMQALMEKRGQAHAQNIMIAPRYLAGETLQNKTARK
ncbi:MAG: GntR family transcriptional regulator [Planctomycetes bacterium]|nr:GntR family transcriptional regulator [Planctomycetota bacterium]